VKNTVYDLHIVPNAMVTAFVSHMDEYLLIVLSVEGLYFAGMVENEDHDVKNAKGVKFAMNMVDINIPVQNVKEMASVSRMGEENQLASNVVVALLATMKCGD